MKRPRLDQLGLLPAIAAAALGALMILGAHALTAAGRLVELVDTAHDCEGDDQ